MLDHHSDMRFEDQRGRGNSRLLTYTQDVSQHIVGLFWRKLNIMHIGGCQNDGPFVGTLNNRCCIIIGIPKRDHSFDNHPYGGNVPS